MKKYSKFAALVVIIIGTLVWLATAGISENKTYYITVSELNDSDDAVRQKRLRVVGDVEEGSIVRNAGEVAFTLKHENQRLKVVYRGIDPLPDTFRDRAQALADGRLGADGVFEARKIQAKCASKYEAKPGEGGAPVYESAPGAPKVKIPSVS
ncbi:MAG: cytochrome c maturation protein CcmE [Bryobacteraceae bacterium]